MASRTQYEHLLYPGGALPPGIFTRETAPNQPIPTKVEYSSSHGATETYRQELDSDGRLLSITLDGRGTGPYLTREWTGEQTYMDTLAGGEQHSVTEGTKEGELVVTHINGKRSTLIKVQRDEEGIIRLIAQDDPESPNSPISPDVHVGLVDPDGKVLSEEEWPYYEYYGEPFGPNFTTTWEYDDTGDVATITRRFGDVTGSLHFVEDRERNDRLVQVVGTYAGDGMVGYRQTREYDSDGRVEAIRDRVHVPTSAIRDVTLELSYD